MKPRLPITAVSFGFLLILLSAFMPGSLVASVGNSSNLSDQPGSGQIPAGLSRKDWDSIQAQLPGLFLHTYTVGPYDSYDDFAYSVALSRNTLAVGAPEEDGGPGDPLFNSGAVYMFERNLTGPGWSLTGILSASDAQSQDYFGTSVALNRDTLVVGAPYEEGGPGDPAPQSGAVYIFERDLGGPGNWGEAAILHASDLQSGDVFGQSIALGEDTLAVGATGEDGGPGDPRPWAGAVYLFERDLGGPGNWGEAAVLHASDAQQNDNFGSSLTLDGDILAVGATGEDGGPGDPIVDAGSAYIFERDLGGPGTWGEAAVVHASDAQDNDAFGFSTALYENTLVIGANREDGGFGDPFPDSGAAYVLEHTPGSPGTWEETAILHASDAQQNDKFGWSLALDGYTLLVGSMAVERDPGAPLPSKVGEVYVFERDPGVGEDWGEVTTLRVIYYGGRSAFGRSLALDGDTAVAGAGQRIDFPPLYQSGAAYVFKRAKPVFLPIIFSQTNSGISQ